MILVVDNYDSFTYNLVHYLAELGASPRQGECSCPGKGKLTGAS